MKLRNKENRLTGKLTYLDFNIDESEKEIDLTILLDNRDGECIDRQFYSLDELKKFLRDWEEVKEPLIKDPKIRKAVRAWAEATGIGTNDIKISKGALCITMIGWKDLISLSIDFETSTLENLRDDKEYTLSELCGEEEE